MKKQSKLLVLAAFTLLGLCQTGCGTNSNNKTDNTAPVLAGDDQFRVFDEINTYDNKMRVNGGEVPDPFIYRFNGMYYLYFTTGGKCFKAYKSSDLLEWEPVDNGYNSEGYVYVYADDDSDTVPKDGTPYAPEVIYRDGKFYLVASPSGNGHYILESDSPEGPFTSITDNIGLGIDGSYFIDRDESVYLYTSGLNLYAMEDDMVTIKKNSEGGNYKMSLANCKVGAWNEGPYMLQRNGEYYFTYCGTHYLSRDYRVDYAYAKAGADISKNSSYNRQGTLVLSTEDDFHGLGHSCTVLGPDMDSYYITYHNLEGYLRYLNYSRLSFNGSKMVANDIKKENMIGLDGCAFNAYDISEFNNQDDYYLSSVSTEDTFTVEFNTIGEGEMIFSYVDSNNYNILEFKNNIISIYEVKNGKKNTLHQTTLIKTYRTDVYHTFRLQHRNGKVNLYFDSIEKESGLNISLKGGKMGYAKSNTFEEIGYTACSNVALGSSDNKAFNGNTILANAYDEKLSYLTGESGLVLVDKGGEYKQVDSYNLALKNTGDRATYRIYEEGGDYSLNIRVPKDSIGKKIGVRIDDGEVKEYTIKSDKPKNVNGDVLVNVANLSISEGQHYLSIYYADEVEFSELHLEEITYDDDIDITFDQSFDDTDWYVRNDLYLSNRGINSNDQATCGVVSRTKYNDVDLTVDFSINEPSSGHVAVLFNIRNYSKHYSGDADGANNNNCYQGFRVEFNGTSLSLKYVDYNFVSSIKSIDVDYEYGDMASINIIQEGNNCKVYMNDEKYIDINYNVVNLSGAVGVLANGCNATIKSLSAFSNL